MPQYKDELANFLPSQKSLEVFADSDIGKQLLHSFDRCLIWLKLLQLTYNEQSGEVLLFAAHSKIVELWVLVPLRLLHPAFSSLRTMMDIVFSYSYYVYHPKEWDSICLGENNWEGRAGILDWHIQFSPHFQEYNKGFGIRLTLDKLHEELSHFIHGIPIEGLPTMLSLDRAELEKTDITPVVELAARVDNGLNTFLIGVFHSLLPTLSQAEYKSVLAGIDKAKLADCGITLPSV
ncbi:MAG: hypothetical protein WB588_08495 [Dehalococcoidia bacterium]